MQAVRRLAGGDPGIIVDAGMGIVAAALTAVAVLGPPGRPGLVGTPIAGPSWLLALLPLLLGAPLLLRRRAPLLMWTAIWAALALLYLLTGDRPESSAFGPYPKTPTPITFVLLAAAYSLGAHASPRRAAAGLVLATPVVVEISHDGGLGLAFGQGDGSAKAVTLAVLQLVAFWLAGVLVRARRQAVSMAARSAALERQAEQAVAAERARIARELHDIVAHHLSVVVLHAAGARASGGADPATLEEIERSGRQALTETRRLFSVLRDPDQEVGRAPQPGISELPTLAGSLRAAGLEVSLSIDGDHAALPPAVNVSAYRIVQEALTNTIRHAGASHAQVTIAYEHPRVHVRVADDGTAVRSDAAGAGPAAHRGHGIDGMRERAGMHGGALQAGPAPGGGWLVTATLLPAPPGLAGRPGSA
jgi:signal transduction histidine kinase